MFTKQDTEFGEVAADPIRRRAMIAALSWRRTVMFWCVMVMSVCALAGIFAGIFVSNRAGAPTALGLVFAAAINWGVLFKMESDLRLLRVIDRLPGAGAKS